MTNQDQQVIDQNPLSRIVGEVTKEEMREMYSRISYEKVGDEHFLVIKRALSPEEFYFVPDPFSKHFYNRFASYKVLREGIINKTQEPIPLLPVGAMPFLGTLKEREILATLTDFTVVDGADGYVRARLEISPEKVSVVVGLLTDDRMHIGLSIPTKDLSSKTTRRTNPSMPQVRHTVSHVDSYGNVLAVMLFDDDFEKGWNVFKYMKNGVSMDTIEDYSDIFSGCKTIFRDHVKASVILDAVNRCVVHGLPLITLEECQEKYDKELKETGGYRKYSLAPYDTVETSLPDGDVMYIGVPYAELEQDNNRLLDKTVSDYQKILALINQDNFARVGSTIRTDFSWVYQAVFSGLDDANRSRNNFSISNSAQRVHVLMEFKKNNDVNGTFRVVRNFIKPLSKAEYIAKWFMDCIRALDQYTVGDELVRQQNQESFRHAHLPLSAKLMPGNHSEQAIVLANSWHKFPFQDGQTHKLIDCYSQFMTAMYNLMMSKRREMIEGGFGNPNVQKLIIRQAEWLMQNFPVRIKECDGYVVSFANAGEGGFAEGYSTPKMEMTIQKAIK